MSAGPKMRSEANKSRFSATLFVTWTGLFAVAMAYNWGTWPNCSILFGPFWIIMYLGLDAWAIVCTLCLLVLLFAFPVQPSRFTALASAVGLVMWLLLGLAGQGNDV